MDRQLFELFEIQYGVVLVLLSFDEKQNVE